MYLSQRAVFTLILFLVVTITVGAVALSLPLFSEQQPPEPQNSDYNPSLNASTEANSTLSVNISDEKQRLDTADLPEQTVQPITTLQTTSTVIRTISVSEGEKVNQSRLSGLNATIIESSGELYRVQIAKEDIDSLRSKSWVERIIMPAEAKPASTVSQGANTVGATQLHEQGITGSDVNVGVLSCEGFAPSDQEIERNVAGMRSFSSAGITNSGDNDHGTNVAAVVVDVAPDANLYLANHEPEPISYRKSINWLKDNNVDVIAFSCGFAFQPDNGDGFYSQALSEVAQNGTPVFVAAGNWYQKHYESRFTDSDDDGIHEFSGEIEASVVSDGGTDTTSAELKRNDLVIAELQWDEWPTATASADIILYDLNRDTAVATSEAVQDGSNRPVERLRHQVSKPGTYALVIHSEEMTNKNIIELTVFQSGYKLQHSNGHSSIAAPAVGEHVAGVAAAEWETEARPEYSSAGPTDDGRIGVSFTAPTRVNTGVTSQRFGGTSAAAPHAAGVAALVLDARPSFNSTQVYQRMIQGADNVGHPATDFEVGSGQINATEAVPVSNTSIVGYTVTPTNATIGQAVNITATIENTGPDSGSQRVSFTADGDVFSRQTVTVAGESRTIISTSVQFTVAGAHNVSINEREPTEVTVKSKQEEQPSLYFTPNSAQIGSNQTATIDISINNTTSGIGAYNLTISTNSSIIRLTELKNKLPLESRIQATQRIDKSNTTATIAYAIGNSSDDGSVTLSSITVRKISEGVVTLRVEPNVIADEAGNAYNVSTVNTTVSVASNTSINSNPTLPGFENPAADPDTDGQLEDVNGENGADILDVVALAANLDTPAIQKNPEQFNFNDDSDNTINILDVVALQQEV